MPYSTQIDIERAIGADRVVQLADDDNDNLADASVVDEAIAWADGEIDSYAAGKYDLPFKKNGVAATPAKIVDRSAELAGAWLYRRKQVVDEAVGKMHAAAIAWLKELQAGRVSVDADPATANVGAGGDKPESSSKDTVFTDDKLERF